MRTIVLKEEAQPSKSTIFCGEGRLRRNSRAFLRAIRRN